METFGSARAASQLQRILEFLAGAGGAACLVGGKPRALIARAGTLSPSFDAWALDGNDRDAVPLEGGIAAATSIGSYLVAVLAPCGVPASIVAERLERCRPLVKRMHATNPFFPGPSGGSDGSGGAPAELGLPLPLKLEN